MATIERVMSMSFEKTSRASAVHYITLRDMIGCDDPFGKALSEVCASDNLDLSLSLGAFSNADGYSVLTGDKTIIVYPSLRQSIEIGLIHGVAIERLIERWLEMADTLSQLFRENRSRIELIEVSGLKRGPDSWLASFIVLAGMSQRSIALLQSIELPDHALTSLYYLHAQQLLPSAKALMQELEAYSHPVDTNLSVNDTPDLEPVITYLNGPDNKGSALARTLLEEHLSITMAKLAAAEAANSALQDENRNSQELRGKLLALNASMNEKGARINVLEKQIKAIRASHSWRITAPIRAVINAVRKSPF